MNRSSISDAHPARAETGRWPWPAWVPALVAMGLYAQTVTFGFVFDDAVEVVRNAFIRSWAHLPDIFGASVWAGAGVETTLYRPLAVASYAVSYSLSGLAPWSHHGMNVLLYGLVCWQVGRLGRALGLGVGGALVAALWFAVMPVHVESVANVVGRKQLLVAAGLLAMLLAHRRATDTGSDPRRRGLFGCGALLAYAAAMMSKESGVVGLALVLTLDLVGDEPARESAGDARPAAGRRPRRGAPLYALYALALGGYLTLRAAVVGGFGMADIPFLDNPLAHVSTLERVLTATAALGQGVALQLAPLTLSPDYGFDAFPLVTTPADPRVLLALVAAGLAAVLAWRERRRSLLPLGAVAWYAASISPASNLLFPGGVLFAERLLFVPSIATCLAGGYVFERLAGGERRRLATWVAGLAMAAWAVRALVYTPEWSDELRLRTYTVRVAPRSAKAHMGLAVPLYLAGQRREAEREARAALRIRPGYYLPHAFLGRVYAGSGRIEEAERHLLRAIALGEGKKPEPYVDLAGIRAAQGRREEARALMRRAREATR